jgi:hypothetical protein
MQGDGRGFLARRTKVNVWPALAEGGDTRERAGTHRPGPPECPWPAAGLARRAKRRGAAAASRRGPQADAPITE